VTASGLASSFGGDENVLKTDCGDAAQFCELIEWCPRWVSCAICTFNF
jgi:hypothetical protein